MATSIALYDQPSRSIASIGAQRTAIRELLQAHMVDKVHYGIIPGTPKPTLYKPGSELLLSMLNLAAQPVVEDLSTPDEMRYRVFVKITEMGSGRYLGEGVGEASSAESKYQWRAVLCQQEWDATPVDRRRVKFQKGYQGNAPTQVQQVRTEMSDVANTILKMAKKRAQIDATLTVTAASDLFMQDAQEVIDAGIDLQEDAAAPPAQTPRPTVLQPKQQPLPSRQEPVPQRQQPTTLNQTAPPQTHQQRPAPTQQSSGGPVISEAQARRFYAIAKATGYDNAQIDEYLRSMGFARKEDITRATYEKAVEWAEGQ